jgi:acyl-CoA synthetase (AMP-forming)/AMP-acid ligase II
MNVAELMLRRAQVAGDSTAIAMGRRSVTYAEFARDSDRVAFGLRELGVRTGDRVVMFAENSIEHLVTYLATARLGAIFTPVHPSFQVSELRYVLANSEPKASVRPPKPRQLAPSCWSSAMSSRCRRGLSRSRTPIVSIIQPTSSYLAGWSSSTA